MVHGKDCAQRTAHLICRTRSWCMLLQRLAHGEPVSTKVNKKMSRLALSKWDLEVRCHIGQNHPTAAHIDHRAKAIQGAHAN